MNSPEVKKFLRLHSSLFWYIPEDKKEEISEEVLVEFILNYGDLEAVKGLFKYILSKIPYNEGAHILFHIYEVRLAYSYTKRG